EPAVVARRPAQFEVAVDRHDTEGSGETTRRRHRHRPLRVACRQGPRPRQARRVGASGDARTITTDAELPALLQKPPYVYVLSLDQRHALLAGLPADVSPPLLDQLLEHLCSIDPLAELARLPAHHDEAIVRYLEAHPRTHRDCAFVLGALRAS